MSTTYKVASVFQVIGKAGVKDRETLALEMLKFFKSKGQTHNVKGRVILKSRVKQQISAMIRDINQKRGLKTQSWWSKLKVVETNKEFKLVPI